MTVSVVKVLAVSISAIALAACSSGGSSSSSSTTTTTPVVTSPTTGSTNSNTTNNAIKGNQINLGSNQVAGANQATAATNNVATVTIDGKSASFDLQGISTQKVTITSNNITRIGSGSAFLANSRFGYIKEGNGTPALFSQGVVTTNMPTTGTATYKGFATHVANGAISMPDANFTVDYGNKTVAGTIKAAGGDVALAGTISGSQFSGSKNGVSTNGYFYGNNAAELGGTYKNTAGSVSGAYGAKK